MGRVRADPAHQALRLPPRFLIGVGGQMQHFTRMFARLAGHFQATEHARQFFGAFVHGEFEMWCAWSCRP